MEPRRDVALRRFRWVLRLSLAIKLAAIFGALVLILTLLQGR